jgi:hypothetical protein
MGRPKTKEEVKLLLSKEEITRKQAAELLLSIRFAVIVERHQEKDKKIADRIWSAAGGECSESLW